MKHSPFSSFPLYKEDERSSYENTGIYFKGGSQENLQNP